MLVMFKRQAILTNANAIDTLCSIITPYLDFKVPAYYLFTVSFKLL